GASREGSSGEAVPDAERLPDLHVLAEELLRLPRDPDRPDDHDDHDDGRKGRPDQGAERGEPRPRPGAVASRTAPGTRPGRRENRPVTDELLSISEALDLVLEHVAPLEAETVPLAEAAGRVLADPATAAVDLPSFPASAMDGF